MLMWCRPRWNSRRDLLAAGAPDHLRGPIERDHDPVLERQVDGLEGAAPTTYSGEAFVGYSSVTTVVTKTQNSAQSTSSSRRPQLYGCDLLSRRRATRRSMFTPPPDGVSQLLRQ